MKAVILCGGFGTRFSEETKNKPKPMIKIGGFPTHQPKLSVIAGECGEPCGNSV